MVSSNPLTSYVFIDQKLIPIQAKMAQRNAAGFNSSAVK